MPSDAKARRPARGTGPKAAMVKPAVDGDSPVGGTAPRPYHHGDLRAALVEAGLRLLADRQADDLGLREVAREVGVSATAVYRHFPDKDALRRALAHEAMERLARAQRLATRQAGGGRPGFLASGLAYVRFAADNPALFRLIFSSAPADDMLDAPLDAVATAMRDLRADILALMPPGLPEPARKAAALHAWALVHGLAQLQLDGQIPTDWALTERVLNGFTALLDGPAPARPKPAGSGVRAAVGAAPATPKAPRARRRPQAGSR